MIKIGLIGKTNTGKTTFFNSATLMSAEVSNYPFTTKKPAVGNAHAITHCIHKEFNLRDNPKNSGCIDGWRFVEQLRLRARRRVVIELREKLSAAAAHRLRQLRLVIREEGEWAGGVELLAHEQHRRLWREQQHRRDGAQACRRRELVQ